MNAMNDTQCRKYIKIIKSYSFTKSQKVNNSSIKVGHLEVEIPLYSGIRPSSCKNNIIQYTAIVSFL